MPTERPRTHDQHGHDAVRRHGRHDCRRHRRRATGDAASASRPSAKTARQLTLVMAQSTRSRRASFGFALSGDGSQDCAHAMSTPGPPLVLRRGEPVEIAVVNRLGEPTALHWHGMELDSYYDGVHNWSGAGKRVAPMIGRDGRSSCDSRRRAAGTFMYHTHLHDERQLPLGLYGAMIVAGAWRSLRPERRSHADGRPPRPRSGGAERVHPADADGDQRRAITGLRLEGWGPPPDPADQHHAGRHRVRGPADAEGAG